MRFSVLGSLQATQDGADIDIGPAAQRAVLASLLIRFPATAAKAAIIGDVWGPNAGAGMVVTLRAHVSRLRAALGQQVLITQPPGYRLDVDRDDVDACRFVDLFDDARSLAARGADRQARSQVVQALALWRSEPFADIDRDFVREEAVRLNEMRMAAVEFAVDLDLALGAHAELVQRLPDLVRRHPLREGLRGSLMVALYRCGRQAEALQLYEQGREVLLDELGVDPGPELRTLHGLVLRQDRTLDAPNEPVTVPAAPGMPVAAPGEVVVATTNVPGSLNPILGRDPELEMLALSAAHQRLTTIIGTGGMGKTRLALEVARRRRDPDGPWLVELAGLTDGSLLCEAIATAMGVSAPQGLSGLVAALRNRDLLLVLDNCEHLTDEVATLATMLLERCPRLRILATSRQTLRAPGEFVFDLPPLPEDAAQRLFIDRAAAAAPGWQPGVDDREIVTQVCRGLDRLPLAIELAAAQCRALSVNQLAEQLDDRFTVLSGADGGNRRHASMTAAIASSYDSLSADERQVFEALALLEGSFALEAANAATARRTALGPLLSLIDKSMVVVVGEGDRRYRILETLRQYAAQQRDPEFTATVQRRIVEWVGAVADEADAELHGPNSLRWMRQLESDSDTIRAALSWARDDAATALRIAAGLVWFWYRSGYIIEPTRTLEKVTHPDAQPTDQSGKGRYLRALSGLVMLRYLAGDYQQLQADLDRVDRLTPETDDVPAKAYALCISAYFKANSGLTDQARQNATTALELAQRIGSPQRAAEALLCLATAAFRCGELSDAERHAQDSIAQAHACGYTWGVVAASWSLAKIRIAAGDFSDTTLDALVKVVTDSASTDDVTSWLVGVISSAYVLLQRGNLASAAELIGIADRQSTVIGFSPEAMDPLETLTFKTTVIERVSRSSAGYQQGHSLTTDQAFTHVDALLAGIVRTDRADAGRTHHPSGATPPQ